MNKIISIGLVAALGVLVLTIHQHHKTVDRIISAQQEKIITLERSLKILGETKLEKFCNNKHLCVDRMD
jgi:hypothetical protein